MHCSDLSIICLEIAIRRFLIKTSVIALFAILTCVPILVQNHFHHLGVECSKCGYDMHKQSPVCQPQSLHDFASGQQEPGFKITRINALYVSLHSVLL